MSILVYAENRQGQLRKWSFELLAYAEKLAAEMGGEVHALAIGTMQQDELQKLAAHGASKVFVCKSNPMEMEDASLVAVLDAAIQESKPSIILIPDSTHGKTIAPRLAARLNASYFSGAFAFPESYEPFILKKRTHSGKTIAKIKLLSPVKVITVANNLIEPADNPKDLQIKELNLQLPTSGMEVKSAQVQTGKILLSDAEIVVSGGRGMKGPENWQGIEELAALLGAATACSRPVSDEGWRPHSEHVGQTGKIVGPTLYFALGISGAIQHLAGVSSSKYIVAVNKDPEAPIFQAADYGVVGDVQKVLPQLIEAVKQLKK